MTPEDIIAVYTELAPEAGATADLMAQRAGAAQAGLGTLANAVMGNSQTAGLGNYTYNRTIRPTVDVLRDSMIASGYSQGLNRSIQDAYNAASLAQQRAQQRAASRASGGGSTSPTATANGAGKIGGVQEVETSGGTSTNGNRTIVPPGQERTFENSGFPYAPANPQDYVQSTKPAWMPDWMWNILSQFG